MNDKLTLLDAHKRYAWVIDQRRQGLLFREIAEKAHEVFGEQRLPKNYDKRYVGKDLARALDLVDNTLQETADEYWTLTVQRYERLLSHVTPMCEYREVTEVDKNGNLQTVEKEPDMRAVDRAIAIIKELARLHNIEQADPETSSDTPTVEENFFVQINQQIWNDGEPT